MSAAEGHTNAEEGPPRYNGRTAPELATDGEDSVRGIVHLAEAYETPLDPVTLYRTLSAVTRLVEQLPEAVTRLSAALTRQQDTRQLTVAAGPFNGDPAAAVAAVAEAVHAALAPLARARTHLDTAQAAARELRVADPAE